MKMNRLGGLAAVLGGVLFAAKAYWDRNDAPPWPIDFTDTFFVVVPLLFLVATVSLYVLCRERLAGIGNSGYRLAIAALAVAVWGALGIWWVFVFGLLASYIGLALAGIDALRAQGLPRWSGLPLAIGLLGIAMFLTGDPANSGLGRNASLVIWLCFGFLWVLLGTAMLAFRLDPAARHATT